MMGTDMHILPEVSHHGEPWRPIRGITMPMKAPRHYPLFAMLADVRNRAGRHERVWMEPSTHPHPAKEGETVEVPGFWYDVEDGGFERLTPITTPRGIPEDASIIWQAFVASWVMRGATMDVSWVGLDEILTADWGQNVVNAGYVTEEEYLALLKDGTPPVGAFGAGGDGVLTVTEEEYQNGKRGEKATSVYAHWTDGPVRDHRIVSTFLEFIRDITEQSPSTSKVRFMLLFES